MTVTQARQGTPTTAEAGRAALDRAVGHLLGLQHEQGWWQGELETNVTMDAEDLLLREFLGVRTAEQTAAAARWIRSCQRADGTWANFRDGDADLSTTVEAYVALRLAGDAPDAGHMARAAAWIVAQGGIPATRVFTRIWLAMFGQWSWDDLPVIPPEMIYLPAWFPLNVYDWACWARQTIVPLTIVGSLRPVRTLPFGLNELHPSGSGHIPRTGSAGFDPWSAVFNGLDRVLHRYVKRLPRLAPARAVRAAAMRRCAEWIIARQEKDGCWGGIQPPWVYSLIALHLLGYGLDHPVISRGLAGLDRFTIWEDSPDGPVRRLEACQSPVWDTVLAMVGLADAGLPPDHPALVSAAGWVLDEEIHGPGDWQVRRPGLAPAGWAFEFDNDGYPDVDDTAEVVLALRRVGWPAAGIAGANARATEWLTGMQSKDGGWGAFDADNTSRLVGKMPFCDFGEVTDPPSADVTAHTVEALTAMGEGAGKPVRRGRGLAAAGPGGRRVLVRALGRELRVRDRCRRARADRRRGPARQARDPARRGLAGQPSEPGRRLGRGPALLRRPELGGPRRVHRVADRLGAAGAARGLGRQARRAGGGQHRPRRGLAGAHPARGRDLGRATVHRDRLPRRLLHQLPPVPAGVPGQRARPIRDRRRTRRPAT